MRIKIKHQSICGKWCILTIIKFILLKKRIVRSEISYVSSNESRATLKNHRVLFGVEERDSPFSISRLFFPYFPEMIRHNEIDKKIENSKKKKKKHNGDLQALRSLSIYLFIAISFFVFFFFSHCISLSIFSKFRLARSHLCRVLNDGRIHYRL